MLNEGKWFEFLTDVVKRLLFGNPIRKAGFWILSAGLGILAVPAWLLALFQWLGISDPALGPLEIYTGLFLVVFGTSLIIGQYIWPKRSPSPDQLMFNRLRQRLPRDTVDFIRDHQFANGFRLERISGAIELADEWRSAETRFHDPDLQFALKSLVSAAQRLVSIIRLEMRAIEPGSDFMLIRRRENGYGDERPYEEVARDLQINARQISEAYEAITMRAQDLKLEPAANNEDPSP
ncbi:hypothetical protein RA19_13730 [Leisingera sp. ANG-M1]|uniref:hypothetical protein n=1 Tax=Leisingera sp. ANG-M1 TaxID=1577895 RepID=UPI00057C5524|nr:hypothetical protein [Leisingera sp. ANG-M1]KIC09825.1 hypothetical protein RA19_13730 [Leisingera sp. ANG-M1]